MLTQPGPLQPTTSLVERAFGSDLLKQLDNPLLRKTRLPKTVIRQNRNPHDDRSDDLPFHPTCSQRCTHTARSINSLVYTGSAHLFCNPLSDCLGDLISPYFRAAALIETAPPILRLLGRLMDYDDCAGL
jgi:hypothetical protein